ncbi:hypothetical protein C8J57DRAFT_1601430 [Mycena rebaudengoi]|nr:hypothetical protein C8J57DRAFT_1601430 [Mycena rebaudengoi]
MSHDQMEIKVSRADLALRKTKDIIEQHNTNPSKKKAKERNRKILSGIQQAVGVLEIITSVDSRAQSVVSVFKGLIKLETDRRDNNEHFLGRCSCFTRLLCPINFDKTLMLYTLRRLRARPEESSEELEQEFDAITKSMEDFGSFTDVYWTKCNKLIRFVRSGDFKEKLEGYDSQFSNHQKRLETLLVVDMAVDVAEIKVDLRALLGQMTTAMNEWEQKARELINDAGGPRGVIENQELLRSVAKQFEEQVTPTITQVLHQNLDRLINENSTQFALKLDTMQREIKEAISSVKWRTFVDGVCNHSYAKFKREAADGVLPQDTWTLKVLTNVINHPAIGEAIDEDATGFISVHEINHFLSQKGDTSTPVWAVGYQLLNLRYTFRVKDLLSGIKERCEAAKPNLREADTACCNEYLITIDLLQYRVKWIDLWIDSDSGGVTDLDDQTESELDLVVTELSEKNEELVRKNLQQNSFHLYDRVSIGMVTNQSCVRIEQVIMLLLYLVLQEQSRRISNSENKNGEDTEVVEDGPFTSQWQSMDATLTILVFEFHFRMRCLIRGWRSQKLDVKLQVQSYAGGLYTAWYEEAGEPHCRSYRERESDDNEEGESGSDNAPEVPVAKSVDDKIDDLAKRLSQLETKVDSKLEEMETLLRQILRVHGTTDRDKNTFEISQDIE